LAIGVDDRRAYADPSFRRDLAEALARAGELLIVVCFAQAAGQKGWYLARDDAELETVLARIPAAGQWGYSDRIEAYATREFPHRGIATDPELRNRAIAVLRQTPPDSEVVLAERVEGNPELHDVEATNDINDIDEWFAEVRTGELLVGPHPFRHDADPDADVLTAWNAGGDGEIRPGAY
jgi:hypothetical protein